MAPRPGSINADREINADRQQDADYKVGPVGPLGVAESRAVGTRIM